MPRPSHAIHFIIGCILASTSSACGQEFNAQQQTQLLKRFPQFDKDGDGELSDSEQRTLLKQILKRYPQADRNGDGVLSEMKNRSSAKSWPPEAPNRPLNHEVITIPEKQIPSHY